MSFKSWLRGWRFHNTRFGTTRARKPIRKSSRWAKPVLEALEHRLAPASYTWNAAAGGNWDTAANWTPTGIPGANDSATITNLNSGASIQTATDYVQNLTVGTNVTLAGGSLTIEGNVTIPSRDTITVQTGTTLIVTNSTLVAQETSYTTFGIVVDGTMNVTNSTFSLTGGYYSSALQVAAGGHLLASGNTFAWGSMTLANGSILNNGDITGNSFESPISIPVLDAPLLANNLSFQNVDILPGSLTNGQSVTLTPIGTNTTVNQHYVFNAATGNFTVQAGATLNVNGASMVAAETNYTTFGIVVDGTINVTNDATFTLTGGYYSSAIQVAAGGHLLASNSIFAWGSMTLANGSILNSGDITGNQFNLPISIPVLDAPLLANNLSFENVDILPGSLTNGQSVTLAPIGTNTTVNQHYVFNAATGNFTVQAGATLNVNGASMVAAETNYTTFGIVVDGTMNVTNNATFTLTGDYYSSAIQVAAGGHLLASNSIFAWGSMTLANGSILNSGDITGNSFELPISIPVIDAPLLANNLSFQNVDILPGSLTNGQSVTLTPIGTNTTVNQHYVFNAATGNFTVQAGATLNVNGASMVAAETSYATFGIVVDGTMNISNNATFTLTGGYYSSAIQVAAGGHLLASNSIFAWGSMTLANGSVLNSGDITGNQFNLPISIPVLDASLLANNLSFQNVDILPGSLTNGQSATLTPIGTSTTVNQHYVFNAATGNFTVQAGATLNVNGASMIAAETSYATFGIVVDGTMNITNNATFTLTGGYYSSALQVAAGGHLLASNSIFAWGSMTLANGSVLNSGDITGNQFNLPISIPVLDASLLANNLSFQNVDILPGSLTNGQSATLTPIGTSTTVNQHYVFNAATGNFTVQAGATLNVNGASMIAAETSYATFGIVVDGTMNITNNATFTLTGGYYSSALQVAAGGHLLASNSIFAWGSMTLANGSVLNSGDITGNQFNLPLSVPIADVPLLTNNQSFKAVDISASSVNAGQTVGLNLMGTLTSVNLSYVFVGSVTIPTGATLNVGAGVPLSINSGLTITDNGTMNITGASSFAIADNNTSTEGIVVNGSLTVSSTTFTQTGGVNTSDHSSIQVNVSGNFSMTSTTFAWDSVFLNAGSSGLLQYVTLDSQITINGNASVSISQNDLSNVGANGVIAVGDPTTNIPLGNNYWGTTNAATIESMILDYNDSPVGTRPTVVFSPPLAPRPAQTIANPASAPYSSAAQNVTLSAIVTSPSGVVNEGTETFTIYNGGTQIGNSVTYNVSNGAVSGVYSLPAGTAPNAYTIQAAYNGTNNYGSCSDANHFLTVSTAATTTTTSNESVTFSANSQLVPLSATVTSSGGTINEGTETFTILSGSTIIGTPLTRNVSSGSASVNYTLPAGTSGGTYTISAVYNDTGGNFAGSSDTSHTLTVSPAPTTTATSNLSTTYSASSQTLTLSATVSSSAGTLNEGTETFTLLSGSTIIGNPVTVNVASDSASANYIVPAATSGGTYTIKAVYNGTSNYSGSTDTSHTLTINAAATTTAASNSSTAYSTSSQTVSLSATVTSSAGTVNEGTETFTIFNGSTQIGNSVTVNVSSGAASAGYTLPANTAPATDTIQAVYNGTVDYQGSTDTSHTLTINPSPNATVSVSLDSNSDSGAPDYPGFTNDNKPTFDVQVNQAGTITIDFDGNSAHDQGQSVSSAGTYQFTAPKLADGGYMATAAFNAGLAGDPQSSTSYTIDTVPPHVASLTPTGTLNNRVSQAAVTFSEPVDLNTFSPSAITLTGPAGSISVYQPYLISGSTYGISFPTQMVQGSYNLVIASSVTDFADNPMGQSFSTSFTIALPDLAVTSPSAPSSVSEGVSFPVGFEVANESPANPTAGTWTDAVYVSTKPVLDGTAVRLASLPGPASPLVPEASYSQNTSVAIPGSLATGNYYLLFVTDDNGGQAESNTSNDVVARPITVLAPDLQVTGVSGPATGFTGQTVLLSWTDENTGPVAAVGPWVDNVFTAGDAQEHNQTLIGSFTFYGSLPAGASVQRTQQVILPQTSGTQFFGVTTNATHNTAESSFTDNTFVSPSSISIAAVPLPDLVVTSITPPANGVFSGNSVPVSFVVKNVGKAPTAAPTWQDWVILSQDPTLAQSYSGQLNPTGPGGDQTLNNQPVILGFTNSSYLGVGDSYQQTVNVPLPLSAQGTWYVYVVPDGTGYHHPFAMPEESRTDKLAMSSAFTVQLSPPPDLAVSGVQAPAQDFSGQPMKLSWTVSNAGNGPTVANSWTDAVYMSASATLDASAVLLGTFLHQGVLANGSDYTSSETVNLPVGVSGSFYFLVKTDLNARVFEDGATANNVASTAAAETVNLTPPPDLEVSSISAPPTATAGHTLTFSYTVTNAGSTVTPNYTWNDALYLSATATFNPSTAISLGEQTHQGSLAADAGYTNTVSVPLPSALAGSYYLYVETDSGDVVFELNKANNGAVSASPITISLEPPDLVVSSVVAPSAALPGSAIWVNWTVVNQSTGDTAVGSWQDSVYIDSGATLDQNAVLLGSFTHYGLLGGGGSYTQAQLVNLPINLLGTYNLFVVANSSGDVYESNTSNDTSRPLPIVVALQVTDPQGGTQQADVADLEVVSVSNTAVTNGNVTVNWTVQNVGTGTTNANEWDDDVWASTNTTLDSGGTDVYLGTVQHSNALAAGANYSASGAFTLPQTLTAGNYYFIVTTDRPVAPPNDPDNEGVETVYDPNTTNNESSSSATTPAAPSALPDLTVSDVSAPVTATSGGQLAVGWTVTNNGAATPNVLIDDSVYLSLDQVFDPGTDLYIGTVTYDGSLASGGSYTQNAELTLTPGIAGTFYVFVVTNTNNDLPEQDTTNNAAYSAQPVQIQLAPPADLVAGTVTTPATALAGENITVTYQVTNIGGNPANGSWTDALYLSSTPTWSINDTLLGTVPQTQDLAPGGSYTGTYTGAVPGVAPGSYYVIVRTNIFDTLQEATLSNNTSASTTQTSIDAVALTLGKPTDGTLNQGQSAYYKVVVGAGQTLQVNFTGQEASAYNELYVSFGTMPTRSQYEFRYGQPFAANQQITVPTTQAGAYYILAYGDTVPTVPESYVIEAAIIPFSIQSVSPSQAGTGPVTLQISGAQFNFGTTFQLRNAAGTVIDAMRTLLQDSATAFATFDLSRQAQGTYNVWAIQSDGTNTELASGLGVVAAVPNSVRLGLVVPSAVLVGRPGTITVTYENPGNTDLPAPLILLDGDNALFQVPGQTGYTRSSLQLIGFNPSGPYGTLPPGFSGSVTVPFEPATAGVGLASTFTISTLKDPNQPFDWNAVAANDIPLDTSAQQWSALVSQAESLMGGTWGSVVSFMDSNSVQLVKNEAAAVDPSALDSLYNFDGLLQYAIGVYGSTNPVPATLSLPVIASEGEVTLYNANVNGSGNPLPLNPSYPTFILIPGFNDYGADLVNLAQAIATDPVCFPNGDVNVVIATWQGATAGPTIDGVDVPWMAALRVDTDGAQLGDLLGSLEQQGKIDFSTTTVLGEGLGVYVGNEAGKIVGGLENALALNPASAYTGYLPPSLKVWFGQSTAYETSSLFDTQLAIAASNQTLNTLDINNPLLLSAFGVTWLTGQIQQDNCYLLNPTYNAGPDNLPPANNPPPPANPEELIVTSDEVVQIVSHDPNTIIGPKISGNNPYVPPKQPLDYSILFTNLPTVQAPAQQIVITEKMDPGLDWRTFRLTSFGFGGITFSVPANSSFYQTTIDLTQQYGFDVNFTATINESTGVATWIFTTIDPATGEVPLNPTIGLLPPDNSSGSGEGFVSYTIMAPATDATGTVIGAQATVTFDTQPPLNTPQIFDTVDAGTGLTSMVAALPAYENATEFNVSWSGTDATNGSGIASYTIYVSDNGGTYSPWLSNTALTAAPFVGQDGNSYSFYSVATDFAGNVQATPSSAQASTLVDVTPPSSNVTGLPAYSPTTFTVNWSGSDGTNGSGIATCDVYVSDDGGAFTPFVTDTTATSAVFTGKDGHTYGFSSVATDNAGNVQATPATAQQTTLVDVTPPSSSVSTLSAYSPASFAVSWSGSDGANGSGIASYDVYVSDDGGTFTLFEEDTTATSAAFAGHNGHIYGFYSVATDKAGNRQAAPTSAQQTTLVDGTAPASSVTSLGAFTDTTSFTVSYTASDPGSNASGLAVVDVYAKGPTDSGYSLAHAFTGSSLTSGSFSYSAGEGDGTYAFYSIATDKAGNAEITSSAQTSTLLDTAKPTSSAGSPGSATSATFTVSYTANDPGSNASGLSTVDIYVKGPTDSGYSLAHAFTGSGLGSGSFSYNAGEGDGTYAFYTIATDKAGNVQATPGSANTTTLVDTTRPASTASSPAYSTSTTFSVIYTASDPGSSASGLSKVDVYVKGPVDSSYSLAFAGGSASSGNFSYSAAEGDGPYSFYSIATDKAGNVQAKPTSANTTTLLDTLAPTSSAASSSFSTSTTFTINYTANDPGSSASSLSEVDVYVKGPTDTSFGLARSITNSGLSGGSFAYTASEGDGSYSFYSVATDKAGNVQAVPGSANTVTLLDTARPTSSTGSPQYSNSTTFSVSYTANDPGSSASGLSEVDVYVKGPTDNGYSIAHAFTGANLGSGDFSYNAGEGDGSYAFYSIATDKAGNVQGVPGSADSTTLVDSAAPNSSVSSPTLSSSATFTVSYLAGDSGSSASGLAEVEVYVKGPNDNGYSLARAFTGSGLSTGNFSYSAGEGDGAYAFYSIAIDRAGNLQAVPGSANTTTLVDTTPPASADGSPTYSTSTTFSVSYTASDFGSNPSGLAEVNVYVKGPSDSGYSLAHAFTGAGLGSGSFSYNAGEGDGSYAFYSIATDKAGNIQTTPAGVNTTTLVDTTLPTSGANSTASSTSATFSVSYTASDPGSSASGLSEVDIYVKGPSDGSYSLAHAFTGSGLGGGSFNFTAGEGDGSYAFYSVATDKAGNVQTAGSAQTSTLLDTSKPTSVADSPGYSDSTTFSVSYTANDPGSNGSGLAEVDIYVKGPTDSSYSLAHSFTGSSLSSGSFNYTAGEGDGSYAFYSVATDKAGNVQTAPASGNTTTLVDTTSPTSSANSPASSTSTTLTVSYTANDPGSSASGLAEVDVYVKGPTDSSFSLAHAFTGSGLGSGSFNYTAGEGDGSYGFYSVATDKAGNTETTSSAQTSTLLDTARPTSNAGSPNYSTSTTFTVSFSASDPGSSASGLAEVDVYAKGPTDSSYSLARAFTGSSLSSGSFNFTAGEGDGSYAFYSVATDKAGNVQTAPASGNTTTLVDTTSPTSSANSPASSTSTIFTVSYTANDPGSGASGLAEVDVYAKGPADSGYSLAHAFTGSSLTSGSFSYAASEGDGSYSFYSVATDRAGNLQTASSVPTSTLLDTAAPTSNTTSLPATNATTFSVGYTAGDPGSSASGLSEVDIYVKGPADSSYSLAHAFTGSGLGGGSFSYTAGEGDGSYAFYSIATDKAGNVQAAPASASTTTLVDTTPPTSNTNSPASSTLTTFSVSYTASDRGSSASDLAEVNIYAKGPTDSGYSLAHAFTGSGLGSGSFNYTASEGDGSYAFYSIATDEVGNVQPTPALPQSSTLVGTATHLVVITQPPSSVTAGNRFRVTVEAVDAGGNVDQTYTGSVALAVSNNTLGGTLTVPAVDGVASFTGLTLSKAGAGFTLRATSSGLPAVVTNSVSVTPAGASQLVVIDQPPANIATGAAIGLVVAAEDPFGNVVGAFNGKVTLTLANNPSGAKLGGTLSATPGNGLAVFDGPTLNKLGTGYTLTASSPSLTAATTNGINVVSLSDKGRIVKGSGQSATVGTTFSGALQVAVTLPTGKPATDVPVTFALVAGSAGGTFQAAGAPTSVIVNTNAAGTASAPALAANTTAGSYSVSVAIGGVVSPVVFSETNKAGAAVSVSVTAGANQTATVGAKVAQAFAVIVKDQYGNVVPNAAITFTAPITGASGTFAVAGSPAHVTVKTNAAGVATAPAFTANKVAGNFSVTALAGSLTASLGETNVAGPPAVVTVVKGGSGQKAAVNTPFAALLQVTVTDRFGNLLAVVPVTFTAPSSGPGGTFATAGSPIQVVVNTDATGVATAPALVANANTGTFIVTANVAGVKKSVSFTETITG